MHAKMPLPVIKIVSESYKTVFSHNRWLWLSPLIFLIWGTNLAFFGCLQKIFSTGSSYWQSNPVHLTWAILILLLFALALTGRFLLMLCFLIRWVRLASRQEPITLRNLFLLSRNAGAVFLCFFLNFFILLAVATFFTLLCLIALLHGLTPAAEILLWVFIIGALLSFIYIQLYFFIIYPTAVLSPGSPLRTGFHLAGHRLGKIFLIDLLSGVPLAVISAVIYQYALLSGHNYGVWAVLSLISTAALVTGGAVVWVAQAYSYTALTQGFVKQPGKLQKH